MKKLLIGILLSVSLFSCTGYDSNGRDCKCDTIRTQQLTDTIAISYTDGDSTVIDTQYVNATIIDTTSVDSGYSNP